MTTEQTGAPTLEEALATLREEYLHLDGMVKPLLDRMDAIKETVRALTPGPDKYGAGDGAVTVSANARFNEARALTLIPPDRVADVTYPETRVDKDRLRVLLPDVWEASQDVHAERVTIK